MRDITITAFRPECTEQAGALFLDEFARLRRQIPSVPDTMANPEAVTNRLDQLFGQCPGLIATRRGRLVGYLGWFTVDDFRRTGRRSACCPAWGHATIEQDRGQVYQLLYQAACQQWTDAGCETHAITLLAHDRQAAWAFFFNGFGVTVVDAIRPIDMVTPIAGHGTVIRRTTLADLDTLAVLEQGPDPGSGPGLPVQPGAAHHIRVADHMFSTLVRQWIEHFMSTPAARINAWISAP